MNCHHFRATQKSIPDAQELILLGGGVKRPPPAPLGLRYGGGVSKRYHQWYGVQNMSPKRYIYLLFTVTLNI